ncbi:transglycosylase SLT domain-containing protein [Nitrogeniibacter aestuarii]|uniref:transglycosylase SLT domain-containing protein n=1 Tax=Nitrogeniibacter aestuarii TaxID=2815343 RepID=UPI001E32C0BC|nr:transglycosylase SLT domain-containing protein [Nitrogeniibacter aestuarii]
MHAMNMRQKHHLAWLLLTVITIVIAGTSYADFLHALGQRESSLRPEITNRSNYAGLYQMGEAALQDAGVYGGDGRLDNRYNGNFTGAFGVNSLNDFLSDPDAQTQAITAYHQAVWGYLNNNGSSSYVGQTINGIEVTESGLIAAAHLVGAGKVKQWLASGGAILPRDGNGTKMTEYLQRFAGYSLPGAAPSYAAVLAAAPTGGAATMVGSNSNYVYTPTPLVSGNAAAAGPAVFSTVNPSYASAQQGWNSGSGFQMGDLRLYIAKLLAVLAFVYLATVMIKGLGGTLRGGMAVHELGQVFVRGALVLILLIYIVN